MRAVESDGQSGEIIVRKGTLVGRLHIAEGRIAWIHTDGQFGYLTDLITARTSIRREQLTEILVECRRAGQALGDALVGAGLLDPARLRELLAEHMRTQLYGLLDHPEAGAVLFLPSRVRMTVKDSFTVEDVLGQQAQVERRRDAETVRARMAIIAERLEEVPGAIGGGVVTSDALEPSFELLPLPHATTEEIAGLRQWAQRTALHADTVDDQALLFTAQETMHTSAGHRIFELRDIDSTSFVVARPFGPIGGFAAAARDALTP